MPPTNRSLVELPVTLLVDLIAQDERREEARQREKERASDRPRTHYEAHHRLLGRVTQAYRMMELIELDVLALGSGHPVFLAVRTCRLIMSLQKKLLLFCFKSTWQYADMMRDEEKRMEKLYSSHALYPKQIGGSHARIDVN